MNMDECFSKLVDVNGKAFQFEKAIEEASELIQAIQKMKQGKASVKDVINEMADVLITFGCMKESMTRDHDESFNVDKLIDDVMKQKTAWVEEYDGKSDIPLTWQDFTNDTLADAILEDFNNAADVKDTVWYDDFTTLYDRIICTIDNYNKAKKGE